MVDEIAEIADVFDLMYSVLQALTELYMICYAVHINR
jgi:hypothetical protein